MTLDERITHIQDAYRLAFRSLAKREVAYKHEIANTHKRLEAELRADIDDAIKEYHAPKQTHTEDTHTDTPIAYIAHILDELAQVHMSQYGRRVYRRDFL
jgi:hypothetical protein